MIVTDQQPQLISVTVFGDFTLADYREFEASVDYQLKFEGPVNLLVDLRQMADYTLDVVWEDIKFTRAHAHDFKRIAVITDSQWVAWSAWLSQIYVDAEVQIFADLDDAKAWLAEENEV